MAKFLCILSKKNDEYTDNWVVYPENVSAVLNKMGDQINDNFDAIKNTINKFYTDFNEADLYKYQIDGVSFKVLDDDEMCIPNKHISFMFQIEYSNGNVEYKVIEHDIASYAMGLVIQDMDYNNCSMFGRSYYKGEGDIAYRLVTYSSEKQPTATFHMNDGTTVKMTCYKLHNL